MNPILAIARLTMKSAVQSRVVAVLIVFLLIAIIGLPLIIQGDGTLEGQVRILLHYTFAACGTILSLAAIWTSCGSVSQELDDKVLQLILTRPVRRAEIWFGKWLGVIFLQALLLLFSGGVIYGMLCWTIRPSLLSAENQQRLHSEILAPRLLLPPQPDDVSAVVERRLKNSASDGHSTALRYREFTREERRIRAPLPPGQQRTWVIPLPSNRPHQTRLQLHVQILSSQPERSPVPTEWQFGHGREKISYNLRPDSMALISIPSEALKPQDHELRVACANLSTSATIVFEPETSLHLGVYYNDFTANVIRSFLILFFRLAFLAALGLSAGCFFHMPTAFFFCCVWMFISAFGGYIAEVNTTGVFFIPHGADETGLSSWTTGSHAIIRTVYQVTNLITGPQQEFAPAQALGNGLRLSWFLTVKALAFYLVLTLLVGALGVISFNRREAGRPE